MLGGSGESRPLPIRVILQGFFAPLAPDQCRPFPALPDRSVRN